ncbi:hypothetical protein [Pantoea sp. Nvir]|uniref:hypothetical protein n=1 Tax=Pantoea sp. Nvir TaxID=2576760 RepID=UPI0035BE566C
MILEAGGYVKFIYNGVSNECQEFILFLHSTFMTNLGLIRRYGQNIEQFYLQAHR